MIENIYIVNNVLTMCLYKKAMVNFRWIGPAQCSGTSHKHLKNVSVPFLVSERYPLS